MQFHDSSNSTATTELQIAAAKHNEKAKGRDENRLMRMIADYPNEFVVVRSLFSGLLTSYATTFRSLAADILHDFFSTPRGGLGPSAVMHDKLDAVHEMLGLQRGQALLDTAHPLCREYPPDAGGGIRRMFPPKGSSMTQVFSKHNEPESETAKFLAALGELRILLLLLYCAN